MTANSLETLLYKRIDSHPFVFQTITPLYQLQLLYTEHTGGWAAPKAPNTILTPNRQTSSTHTPATTAPETMGCCNSKPAPRKMAKGKQRAARRSRTSSSSHWAPPKEPVWFPRPAPKRGRHYGSGSYSAEGSGWARAFGVG